jgi:two-component system, NtrC family, nitrogen regulation response regulator NtrX
MAREILVIDDEAAIRSSLSGVLKDESFGVMTASSGEEGLGYALHGDYDVVLLDVWLPGMDGLETLKRIKAQRPEQLVIIMSGHGNIETAVRATKLGAYDYIEKPLSLEKLLVTLRNALQFKALDLENRALKGASNRFSMVGNSPNLTTLREQIEAVAPLNSWVLITGENGTGKELVARAIHSGSKRKDQPFIAVNCAAIPEELIESELFGHERGAFTGAIQQKKGKFDQADGGTLLLDEIADMSLKTQAKVLRILQEKKFERVGGNETIEVDVRVLAATNKNLLESIKNQEFREDLYYRLNVIPLQVPALRQRREDLEPLFDHFFAQSAREQGAAVKRITPGALQILKDYSWPGNIRELRNLAERLSILCRKTEIEAEDLPAEILAAVAQPQGARDDVSGEDLGGMIGSASLKEAKARFEKEFIERKLREHDWNVSRTAQSLGVERAHLHRKIRALKINEVGDE